MTDLRKAVTDHIKDLRKTAIVLKEYPQLKNYSLEVAKAADELEAALAQPKYHRGDRLLCLESEEYCVIHISGTDRQWVKFPDSHIGAYTNEQVQELFELLPKETDEALAQPEQYPVAWWDGETTNNELSFIYDGERPAFPKESYPIPLYTAPPKREWVGLTDEEIAESAEHMEAVDPTDSFWREFSQEIEAKLKEKNT